MQNALIALLLGDLGRDALKLAAGLALALVIALAFTISSVSAIFAMLLGATPTGSVPVQFGAPIPGASGVVAVARTQLGMPYVWGGASPQTSFDCSGLVQWSYAQIGLSLPRTAQEQYDATARVAPGDLLPGDLVFFAFTYPTSPSEPITHVGIYVGGGQMINAPDEGDVVREMPVFSGFWGAHFAGGGRVER